MADIQFGSSDRSIVEHLLHVGRALFSTLQHETTSAVHLPICSSFQRTYTGKTHRDRLTSTFYSHLPFPLFFPAKIFILLGKTAKQQNSKTSLFILHGHHRCAVEASQHARLAQAHTFAQQRHTQSERKRLVSSNNKGRNAISTPGPHSRRFLYKSMKQIGGFVSLSLTPNPTYPC